MGYGEDSMMRHLLTIPSCSLALVLIVGCGSRLNQERTVSVEFGEERILEIDPPSGEQKVRVQVTASGTPVSVYCFLKKHQAEAEKAIRAAKASNVILDSAERSENASLEFTVPAKEGSVVLLKAASAKKANASVKITGS
jgi:hypothetical protein